MSIEAFFKVSAQQAVFRIILEATSRPGRIFALPANEAVCSPAMQLLATLVDGSVSLHDRTESLGTREWGFLQANPAKAESARFILTDARRPPDVTPFLGSLESPETGATLILQVESLGLGPFRLKCSGPGIEAEQHLNVLGLDQGWLTARMQWNAAFPLGVDIYLTDASKVACLPRTTSVATME